MGKRLVFHWGTAREWGTAPALLPRREPGVAEGVEGGPDPENRQFCSNLIILNFIYLPYLTASGALNVVYVHPPHL